LVDGEEESNEAGWGVAEACEISQAGEAEGDAEVAVVGVGGYVGDRDQVRGSMAGG